jgi:hypothetical protein
VGKNYVKLGSKATVGRIYTIDWTTGSVGTATGSVAALSTPTGDTDVCGFVRYIETIPGANGDRTTAKPTSTYSVYMYDAYSYDVLAGAVTARSTTAAERVNPTVPPFICAELLLTVSNPSASKQGRINLLISDF